MNHSRFSITTFCLAFLWALPALAGNLDNAGAPSSGSAMPTLQGIYQQLLDGTTATTSGTFQEPASGPTAGTGRTLAEIGVKLPVSDNTNGAQASDVLSGKTFWGLRTDGTWGLKSGTKTNNGVASFTPGQAAVPVPAGYYSGGQVNTDANLVSGNIMAGKTIFGVSGTVPPGALPHAGVKRTGQTTTYATGDDGYYRYGVNPVIAPTGGTTGAYNTPALVSGTRFFDNGDGTVIDNITGLIWLKNANCTETVGGVTKTSPGWLSWDNALTWSNALASGKCGLTDNSTAGQWRLPNINELHSQGPTWPPGTPLFTAVQYGYYWSSSTYVDGTDYAWFVFMPAGDVGSGPKPNYSYVWPVRSGQ